MTVCSTCSNADVVIPLATETMTWTPLIMVWWTSSITDRTRCGLTAMITNWECWTTILLLKVVLHPQSLKKDCFIYIIYILQSSRKNYYVTVFYTIFYKYISSFKVKYYIYIHLIIFYNIINVVCCVGRVEIQIEIEKGRSTDNMDSIVKRFQHWPCVRENNISSFKVKS